MANDKVKVKVKLKQLANNTWEATEADTDTIIYGDTKQKAFNAYVLVVNCFSATVPLYTEPPNEWPIVL